MGQQVTFSKSIGDRAYLPTAGKYGHGLDYEADVTVDKFEYLTTENKPAFAKDGDGRNWAFFLIKVIFGGKTVFIRHHEQVDVGSGSMLKDILLSMGVELTDDGENIGFDASTVAPRKITGIEVEDPRADKTKKNPDGTPVLYTGNLTGVKVIG